jgi:hypothetical protein
MTDDNTEDSGTLADIAHALQALSFWGPDSQPGALEGLSVALGGDSQQLAGLPHPVGKRLGDVAREIGRVADALESIADALTRGREDLGS